MKIPKLRLVTPNFVQSKLGLLKNGLALVLVLIALGVMHVSVSSDQPLTHPSDLFYQPLQRFGIAAPFDFTLEQLEYFNIRAVLDWRLDNPIELPETIDYLHVVRLSDAEYSNSLSLLPSAIDANPAEVWIIGNEPDRSTYQDSISPEVYAARYFEVASMIRALDPEAKLGFGSVVQPTPLRLCYLDQTLLALDALSGSRSNSLALIDIWSIHAFILNEQEGAWGAGIPVGIEENECEGSSDALEITDFSQTHSISIFQNLITSFRTWLALRGEQDKPVWITEYGSLLPSIDPPSGINYVNVSEEETTAFMLATFDFLLNANDEGIGQPEDDNHLIQRWIWYSLNDHLYSFGGSLLNPDDGLTTTIVGEHFKQYTDELVRFYLCLPLVMR